jgi:hypothetical protein
MDHQLVSIMPLLGAWLGLIGWLLSRIGTTRRRMSGIWLSFTALYLILFVSSEIWGTTDPSGSYLARNLIWFALSVGLALVFAALIFFCADRKDNSKVRLFAECASVGMAVLGLAFDTFERSTALPINWTEIVYQVCKERLFH